MLGRQFPTVEAMLRDAEDDLLAFADFPRRALEEDLVHQPARAGQQGDQAPHRRRRDLPQPRRRCSASPAPSWSRPTTSGRSPTAATSPKASMKLLTAPTRRWHPPPSSRHSRTQQRPRDGHLHHARGLTRVSCERWGVGGWAWPPWSLEMGTLAAPVGFAGGVWRGTQPAIRDFVLWHVCGTAGRFIHIRLPIFAAQAVYQRWSAQYLLKKVSAVRICPGARKHGPVPRREAPLGPGRGRCPGGMTGGGNRRRGTRCRRRRVLPGARTEPALISGFPLFRTSTDAAQVDRLPPGLVFASSKGTVRRLDRSSRAAPARSAARHAAGRRGRGSRR